MQIKKPKIPIKGSAVKFSELSRIEDQIDRMTVQPDFGYEKNSQDFRGVTGWRLFYDYVSKEPKYMKLQNFIHNRNIEEKEKQLKEKKNKQSKQVQLD